jgi:ppGpp synthetase/RelA/SpoT-type nucleotidyltranferase
MTLEDYEKSGRGLYERLAETVADILRAALDGAPEIKIQQIQHRAKRVTSLSRKLSARSHDPEKPIEASAKDLAGCRIVVYSNDDVSRIASSRLLVDNFDVDWTRTRVHQPGVSDSTSQFISNNYVIRLKQGRAALPEYRAYDGLWCEVQVQTILNHAWAATAHDTIYKKPDLDGIGKAQMGRIDRRMTRIMEDYLKPAGYEFQKVLDDFERLAAGKQLIDTEILNAIRSATDNNERERLIDQFRENVLPLYDDPSKDYPAIRATMLHAVEVATQTETVPQETGIGLMRGRTPEDVMRRAVSVLDDLRYVDVGATFNAYITLFRWAASDAERKIIHDAVSRLAHYELQVWRRHGPAVQALLLDAIDSLGKSDQFFARSLIAEVCGQCLDADITGTTSTSEAVTWHTAAVVPTQDVTLVRSRARRALLAQLALASSDGEWRIVVSALGRASRLPHQAGYANELLIQAIEDSAANTNAFADQLARMPNLIRQEVEHDVFWLHRRFGELRDDLLDSKEARDAHHSLITAIEEFRERIDGLDDFQIFKTLVGFQSVYPFQWNEPNFDYARREAFRDERMAVLLRLVSPTTTEEWYERLNRYAGTRSDDLATFPSLGRFVSMIAEAQPAIAENWLSRDFDSPLASFRPGMLL